MFIIYFIFIILRLPTYRNNSNESIECTICTERLDIARNLNCNHKFHLFCITKWFENSNNTCPLCRVEVPYSISIKNAYSLINPFNRSNSLLNLINSNLLQRYEYYRRIILPFRNRRPYELFIRIPEFILQFIPNLSFRISNI